MYKYLDKELKTKLILKMMNNLNLAKDNYDPKVNDSMIAKKITHSLRVNKICNYIAIQEKLSDFERETLEISAIMHDISKFENERLHAQLGACKTSQLLVEYVNDVVFLEKIHLTISTHSYKNGMIKYFDKCQRILLEADILEHMMLINYQTIRYDNILKKRMVTFRFPKVTILDALEKRIKKCEGLKNAFTTKTGKKLYKKLLKTLKKYQKKLYKQMVNGNIKGVM
jgi:UTP:GlnB (protein PII) uridylyltransferase